MTPTSKPRKTAANSALNGLTGNGTIGKNSISSPDVISIQPTVNQNNSVSTSTEQNKPLVKQRGLSLRFKTTIAALLLGTIPV